MTDPAAIRQIVQISPDVMSGAPVFKGTRVPVQALLDHLEEGDTLDVFLEPSHMARLDNASQPDLPFPHAFLEKESVRDIVFGGNVGHDSPRFT